MTIAVIPARGGSKGVPKKNIRLVNGKPLIAYTIECALKAPSIDKVVVSTDSEEIAAIARAFGAEVPFIRPSALAADTSPTMPVLRHAVTACEEIYGASINPIVLVDPTAPLRIPQDIENSLAIFHSGGLDAVISANAAHRNPYFNMVQITGEGYVVLAAKSETPVLRRQDAPQVYDLNTICWVFSREAVMVKRERIPARTKLYIVPGERAIDLDTEYDFTLLDLYLKGRSLDE